MAAIELRRPVPDALAAGGQRRHNLVDRAGRILLGKRLVGKGVAHIAVQPRYRLPHIVFGGRVKGMRIKTGIARHRQQLAAIHVQRDQRAAAGEHAPVGRGVRHGVGQRLRHDALQFAVDGQGDRAWRFAQGAGQLADDRAAAFNDAQVALRPAGQDLLVTQFDASAPNQIAAGISQRFPALQFIRRHRAQITHDMRGDAVAVIAARAVNAHFVENAVAGEDGAVRRQLLLMPLVLVAVNLGDMEIGLVKILDEDTPERQDRLARDQGERIQAKVDVGHIGLDSPQAVYGRVFFGQRRAVGGVDVGAVREIRAFGQACPARHTSDDIRRRPGDFPAAFIDHTRDAPLVHDLAEGRRFNDDLIIDDGGCALVGHAEHTMVDAAKSNDAVRHRVFVDEVALGIKFAAALGDQRIHRLEVFAVPGREESAQDFRRVIAAAARNRDGRVGYGRRPVAQQRRLASPEAQ